MNIWMTFALRADSSTSVAMATGKAARWLGEVTCPNPFKSPVEVFIVVSGDVKADLKQVRLKDQRHVRLLLIISQ